MLTCTFQTVTTERFFFRAHIELSIMGYNTFPKKFDTFTLSGQLSVMVLLCCCVHYTVVRMLRRSNLASCELEEKNRASRFDSVRAALKKLDIRDSRTREVGGNESRSGSSLPAEDIDDQAQQILKNEQDAEDRELLEELQRERETVAALYSELEQERNCSASAACEAMAMISRLQEEKAAVQMEARQFKRMVLEKAMYDQEAIENLNALLWSREQEKLALEEEIRVCKEKVDAIVRQERRLSLQPEANSDEGRLLLRLKSPGRVKDEMVDTAPCDQQIKYVDKFSTTDSLPPSTVVQEGGCDMKSQLGRRFSSGIRRKGTKHDETDDGIPDFLDSIYTTPRAEVDEQAKYVDKVTTADGYILSRLVQDGGRGMESGIQKTGAKSEEADYEEPEFLKSITVASNARDDAEPKDVDEVIPAIRQLPSAVRGLEIQARARLPTSGMSRRAGKLEEVLNDAKPEYSGFVSLKRRWGSQEITLKTLEQTKEERRGQEKKTGSVLEYVMKLERQQQLGGNLSHVRR